MYKKERFLKKEEVVSVVPEICLFMESNSFDHFPCGTYQLPKGIYLNVESYETQPRDSRVFEAHRRYIDFQYMIDGREIISVCEKDALHCIEKYDQERDIEFYRSVEMHSGESADDTKWCVPGHKKKGKDYVLTQGEGLLLYPNHAHMPCLRFGEKGVHVKKAVFKIPISYFMDIKTLVFDVDGTLTDGKIYMGNDGEVMKAFDVKDGYGIHCLLPSIGIIPVVITSRNSDIVKRRCMELGINYIFQNVDDKWLTLSSLLDKLNISASNVVYMGDDLNDIVCMKAIELGGGMIACPQNAVNAVKKIADYICSNHAGNGAARELIDFLSL